MSRKRDPEERRRASARYYARHKDRALASLERWRENGGRRVQRSTYMQRTYGITIEDYERMVEERQGACDICGEPPKSGKNRKLQVDHDHVTGKVRGLLCWHCNARLGFIEHELFEKSLEYLRRTR